jgi:hypothetical protein
MFALIALPTTIPGLFISGIDESEPLRHALRFSSALASLCTVVFIPNLILSLVSLTRTSRLSQSR